MATLRARPPAAAAAAAAPRSVARHQHRRRRPLPPLAAASAGLPHDDDAEQLLRPLLGPAAWGELLERHSHALGGACATAPPPPSPCGAWIDFLRGLGLDDQRVAKVLTAAPELLTDASVYESGRTLLFLRCRGGYSHGDILRRIVPQYPRLLARQVERDIEPVVSLMEGLGCGEQDIRLITWEFPRLFLSSNPRKHLRRFAHLQLYGLPPGLVARRRGGEGGAAGGAAGGEGRGAESGESGLQRLLLAFH